MWGRDRATARMSGATTLIAPGTRISGDVQFGGDLEVQGVVRGNICAEVPAGENSPACVRVVAGGRVEGEIRAPLVIINGTVEGDIHASEQVELAAQAEVQGNIHYRMIQMANGAQFNGNLIYLDEPRPACADIAVEEDGGIDPAFHTEP